MWSPVLRCPDGENKNTHLPTRIHIILLRWKLIDKNNMHKFCMPFSYEFAANMESCYTQKLLSTINLQNYSLYSHLSYTVVADWRLSHSSALHNTVPLQTNGRSAAEHCLLYLNRPGRSTIDHTGQHIAWLTHKEAVPVIHGSLHWWNSCSCCPHWHCWKC